MHNFEVTIIDNNGIKKIPVWTIEQEYIVKVRKPSRKLRLNELFPQRAILEDSRSLRKNANDFIDHDYYIKELDKTPERYARIMKKYGRNIVT